MTFIGSYATYFNSIQEYFSPLFQHPAAVDLTSGLTLKVYPNQSHRQEKPVKRTLTFLCIDMRYHY